MPKKHTVIIIPGLGDDITKPLVLLTNHWKGKGLTPMLHPVHWHDGENFAPKLKRLLKLVSTLKKDGSKVSVVGTSAGGCVAVLSVLESKGKVHKAINVCGRLKVGPMTGFRSFPAKTKTSKSFAQAVKMCEEKTKQLSPTNKKKIMTIHPAFGDELVPPETTIIDGALNRTIPTGQHMLSIAGALTVFYGTLTSFLNSD